MERRIKYGNLHNADLLTMRDTNFVKAIKMLKKNAKNVNIDMFAQTVERMQLIKIFMPSRGTVPISL